MHDDAGFVSLNMRTLTKTYTLAAKNIQQQGCGTVPLVIDLIIWKGDLMHQMVL